MIDDKRGTGRTTDQILHAPKDAIYVWVSSNLSYPKEIAKKVGRLDLKIIGPHYLHEKLLGVTRDVIVDHGVRLPDVDQKAVDYARIRAAQS